MPSACASVDEAAEVIGPAVEPRRSEEVDPVISPAERAGEIRHRHDFETGDAEIGEGRQLASCRVPASRHGVKVPTCIS